MAKKTLSTNEMNLNISPEMIIQGIPHKVKKVYILWDISGSMRKMNRDDSKKFVPNIDDYVGTLVSSLDAKGVEAVFVPFGDFPTSKREWINFQWRMNPIPFTRPITYTPGEFSQVKKSSVSSTHTHALDMFFLKTSLDKELYGIYFFGDGNFTGGCDMKTIFERAFRAQKLRNCAFVHCIYPKHTTVICIGHLNRIIQQILSSETDRTIYFDHNVLTDNTDRTFPTSSLDMETCFSVAGHFTVGNYMIPSWMVPSNIATLISKNYPELVFIIIKYMINALKTNIELFLIKDSAYSRMHRVLSILQKIKIVEFFKEDLVALIKTIDQEWGKYWSLGDTDPTELRIEDIYFKVFDTWKMMNPQYTDHCNKLAQSAFGSEMEKSFNRFKQQREASHIVVYDGGSLVLPTNIVNLYEYFVDFFKKKRIRIIKNTEKNRWDYRSSIMTFLSPDPVMAWTTLKFFFKGQELNKIKAFFLGVAISNFTDDYPQLKRLLKARRFTDPYVCEGSFKNNNGTWQSEIFKSKLALPLYEYIQKNMDVEKFGFIDEVIKITNMSNKFGFVQSLFIKMASFLRKLVARRTTSNASPHLGTWLMLKSHAGDTKSNLPGLVYVRKFKKTGMTVQYIDQKMGMGLQKQKPSAYNSDIHCFIGECVIDEFACTVTYNGKFIGEVIPLAKLDLTNHVWKSLSFVKELNKLLMHNFDNYDQCDYDSVHAKIMELLKIGDHEMNMNTKLIPVKLVYSDLIEMIPVLSPEVVTFLKSNALQMNMPIGAYYEFVKTGIDIPSIKDITSSIRIRHRLVTIDEDTELSIKNLKKLISKTMDELHDEFEHECIFCEDTLDVCNYEIPHKCGHIDKVCKDCYVGMKKAVHKTIGEGGRVPIEMATCCMCHQGSRRKAKILFGPWSTAVIAKCASITPNEKMYFCCGNQGSKYASHGCPHKNVVSVEIGCADANIQGGVFKCDQCLDEDAMSKPIFLVKCPHCDNFLQHYTGCNLMMCCQYGAHAHDMVSASQCHGCGSSTDFCGGEFRLSEDIQYVIGTVTGSFNFSDYMEIGIENLFVVTATEPMQYNGWCLTMHGKKYLSGELED